MPWNFGLYLLKLALQLELSLNQFPIQEQHSRNLALALWLISVFVIALQLELSLNQFPIKEKHSYNLALALWLISVYVSAATGA